MEELEILYKQTFPSANLFQRKLDEFGSRNVLYGSPRCGKTSVVIEYFNSFLSPNKLFLNLKDPRINPNNIKSNLLQFIEKNHIECLIIDNYDLDLQIDFDKIDLSCKIFLTSFFDINLNNFKNIEIFPLNFEEFISFDKKHHALEQIFKNFINNGNLPETAVDEGKSENKNRFYEYLDIINLTLSNNLELNILKIIANQKNPFSIFSIFSQLKNLQKISKDLFYKTIQSLQDRKILYFLGKKEEQKGAKKWYFYDFSLYNYLTFRKDFLRKFENMVFLELLYSKKSIMYDDFADFLICEENLAILCIPFLPPEMIADKIKRQIDTFKKEGVKKIEIITVGNEGEIEEDGIFCEIIPFYNWALRF